MASLRPEAAFALASVNEGDEPLPYQTEHDLFREALFSFRFFGVDPSVENAPSIENVAQAVVLYVRARYPEKAMDADKFTQMMCLLISCEQNSPKHLVDR